MPQHAQITKSEFACPACGEIEFTANLVDRMAEHIVEFHAAIAEFHAAIPPLLNSHHRTTASSWKNN